jgi:hypothetical protein
VASAAGAPSSRAVVVKTYTDYYTRQSAEVRLATTSPCSCTSRLPAPKRHAALQRHASRSTS